MRDQARVYRIASKLAAYWSVYPDMRLGQLYAAIASPHWGSNDFYYLEDDLFEKALDAALKAAEEREGIGALPQLFGDGTQKVADGWA